MPPFFLTVRRIENYTTSDGDGDVPVDFIVIVDAVVLSPHNPSITVTEPVLTSNGVPYEDYPNDDLRRTQDPTVVLEAASTVRALGSALRFDDQPGYSYLCNDPFICEGHQHDYVFVWSPVQCPGLG